MKKLDSKGVAPVIIVFLVLAIVGIGFAGYRVYKNSQNKTKTEDTKQSVESKTEKKEETEENNMSIYVKDGYKIYEDDNLQLQHPDNWKTYTKTDQPEWVFIQSPDFIEPQAEGPGPSAEAGYLLEVYVSKTLPGESFESALQGAKDGEGVVGGSYEVIKIDGIDAILSDQKTHGTFLTATTYKNGNTYYFRLNAVDEDKPEVKSLFATILETVDIK